MNFTTKPLRIFYAGPLPECHRGGAAISNAQILVGLAARGHRIRAIAPWAVVEANSPDRFADQHTEIELIRFRMPYNEVDPYNPAPFDYRELQRTQLGNVLEDGLRSEVADLVFVGRESFLWGIPELAERHGVPCVLNTRGVLNAIADGSYPPDLSRALILEMIRTSLAISPAQHMLDKLHRIGVTKGIVIRNTVDTKRFCPGPKSFELVRRLGLPERTIVIMHISNMKPVKRPQDIIDSAERVLQVEKRVAYIMVGDGPMRADLEGLCTKRGLAGRIKFAGWIPYEEMSDCIRTADIVIVPSEAEGLARVYLETQACGRVLLASDIPAAREISDQGRTAVLFRKGDIEEMTTKTLLIARSPHLRTTMGECARDFAERRHDPIEALDAYEAALQGVVREYHS